MINILKILNFVLIFAILAGTARTINFGECKRTLKACTNVTKFPDFLRVKTSDADLSTHCGVRDEVERCIANSACDCTHDQCIGYEYFKNKEKKSYNKYLYWTFYAKDVLAYICQNGKAEFRQYQKCLQDQNYLTLVGSCFRGYDISSNVAWQSCRRRHEEIKCFAGIAESTCSSSQFILSYHKQLISHELKDLYNCQLDYTNWNANNRYSYCDVSNKCADAFLNQLAFTIDSSTFLDTCKAVKTADDCVRNTGKCGEADLDSLPRFARWKANRDARTFVCDFLPANYDRACAVRVINASRSFCFAALTDYSCTSYASRIKCMMKMEEDECGATTFTKNYYTRLLRPVLKTFYKCDLNLDPIVSKYVVSSVTTAKGITFYFVPMILAIILLSSLSIRY